MPAPHRRAIGESLAKKIGSKTASRALDDRDNLVSARTRHAKKFEEVSEALERATGSDLERKADEVRRDFERSGHLTRFSEDVREGKAKPPVIVLTPQQPARYFFGQCLDCSVELWAHKPKPRVPLCEWCKDRREQKRRSVA